jgi:hypothetical protein
MWVHRSTKIATQKENTMTKMCQVSAFRTLILGATMAGGLMGLAAQSQAMMTADEFLASIGEMKRICHVLNEPFVIKKYNYGCGKYVCKGRRCHAVKRKPPRRPNDPPILTHVPAVDTVATLPEGKGGKSGDNEGRDNGPSNNGPNGHSGASR